jgi:hypothetical protein
VDHLNGDRRGYLRCDVDSGGWRSEFRVVEDPRQADSAVRTELEIRLQDV